jgi:hypothetical protein
MTIVNFTPVTALAGGILISVASVWLLAANGRIAGIGGLLAAEFLWRTFMPTATPDLNLGWMAVAGLLIGSGDGRHRPGYARRFPTHHPAQTTFVGQKRWTKTRSMRRSSRAQPSSVLAGESAATAPGSQ